MRCLLRRLDKTETPLYAILKNTDRKAQWTVLTIMDEAMASQHTGLILYRRHMDEDAARHIMRRRFAEKPAPAKPLFISRAWPAAASAPDVLRGRGRGVPCGQAVATLPAATPAQGTQMDTLIKLLETYGPYAGIVAVLMWYIYQQSKWMRSHWDRLVRRVEALEEDRVKKATDFGQQSADLTDKVIQAIRENSMVQRELIAAINHNSKVLRTRPCLHDANESDANLRVIHPVAGSKKPDDETRHDLLHG